MSVQSFSRTVAQLTLDYDLLRHYLDCVDSEGSKDFFPTGETEEETLNAIRQYYGDLTTGEIEMLREGDWDTIFEYIKVCGPGRPTTDPPPIQGGGD